MGGTEQKRKLIINTVFFSLLGVGAYGIIKYLLPVFLPFLFAFLFAALIHTAVKGIPTKSEKGRKCLAVFVTGLFFIVLAVCAGVLGGGLMRLLEKAILTLPGLYKEQFVPWVYEIGDKLEKRYAGRVAGVSDVGSHILSLVQETGESLSEISVERVENVSGYAKQIPPFLIKIVMTVVATFFLAADYERITGFLLRLLPKKGQEIACSLKKHTLEILGAYCKSYSILMLLTFLELCIGLAVLRVPFFIPIAFGIALFDILPVLGTGGILIPWAAIALMIGDYRLAVGLVVLDTVITVLRNILEPKIVGKQIGLHPLAALIALFVGLKIGGIVGMIGLPMGLAIVLQLGKEDGMWYTETKRTEEI